MSRKLLVALAGFALCHGPLHGYTRQITRFGAPTSRADIASVRLLVHDSTAPGMTNVDGEPIITAGSDPLGLRRRPRVGTPSGSRASSLSRWS